MRRAAILVGFLLLLGCKEKPNNDPQVRIEITGSEVSLNFAGWILNEKTNAELRKNKPSTEPTGREDVPVRLFRIEKWHNINVVTFLRPPEKEGGKPAFASVAMKEPAQSHARKDLEECVKEFADHQGAATQGKKLAKDPWFDEVRGRRAGFVEQTLMRRSQFFDGPVRLRTMILFNHGGCFTVTAGTGEPNWETHAGAIMKLFNSLRPLGPKKTTT